MGSGGGDAPQERPTSSVREGSWLTPPEIQRVVRNLGEIEDRTRAIVDEGPQAFDELVETARAHGHRRGISAAIVSSLGQITSRHPKSKGQLLQMLSPLIKGSDEPAAKLTAVEAVLTLGLTGGEIDDTKLADAALSCLDPRVEGARERVSEVFSRLADRSEETLRLLAERATGEEAYQTPLRILISLGDRAHPWLYRLATVDRRPQARMFLLDQLWEVDSDGVPEILCAVLGDDEHEEIRQAALKGLLRYLKRPGISELVLNTVAEENYPSEAVRFAAVAQVYKADPKAAIPALTTIARTDSDGSRRDQAKIALTTISTTNADEAVRKAASDALKSLAQGRGEGTDRARLPKVEALRQPSQAPKVAGLPDAREAQLPSAPLDPEVRGQLRLVFTVLEGIAHDHPEAISAIYEHLERLEPVFAGLNPQAAPAARENPQAAPPLYITPLEAARKIGITDRSVRIHCETGRLQAIQIGRDWFIDPQSVAEFKKNRPKRGPKPKSSN